ncbi:MAG: DUF4365 domain-containing protein [Planctomycetes bacterium]|nr:DUF4365 domain-containing protein [Planctomycetota bacterium]
MKKITDQQILGEQGVNLIQRIALKMGFTWHPSNQPVEAGIDGWVELRDQETGEVANCWLAVQSRARSTLRGDAESVKYTPTQEEVEYWMKGSQPVILVVSQPNEDLAWWVSIKDYFHDRGDLSADRMIVFDKKNDLLSESTATEWKQLGTKHGAVVYFTPPRIVETLSSNLLKVWRWHPTVFSAPTKFSDAKEIREQLKAFLEWPPREWFLGDGNRLFSFHDLSNAPWSSVCDSSKICHLETDDWAYSEDNDDRRKFVRLLNWCLRELVGKLRMRHSPEEDCYYFSPTRERIVRRMTYTSRKKKATRTVVSRQMSKIDTERVAYYRHDGFAHRFLRFGESWYLMIEPRYVFTRDGKDPDPYREERQSKIKTLEGDAAISGKVVMFADLLKDDESLFDSAYPFLGFDTLEKSQLHVGIDDDGWARAKAKHRSSTATKSTKSEFGRGLFDEGDLL